MKSRIFIRGINFFASGTAARFKSFQVGTSLPHFCEVMSCEAKVFTTCYAEVFHNGAWSFHLLSFLRSRELLSG